MKTKLAILMMTALTIASLHGSDDELAKALEPFKSAALKLRIVGSPHWEHTSPHNMWSMMIENTGDKPIGTIGFATKYADRYGNILEVNDANYIKRDDVTVVIPPHQRRKIKFQEDYSNPLSITEAEKGTVEIESAIEEN